MTDEIRQKLYELAEAGGLIVSRIANFSPSGEAKWCCVQLKDDRRMESRFVFFPQQCESMGDVTTLIDAELKAAKYAMELERVNRYRQGQQVAPLAI